MKCTLCENESNVMAIGISVKNVVNICPDCWKLICVGLHTTFFDKMKSWNSSKEFNPETNYYGTYLQLDNLSKTPTKDIDLNKVL